MRPEHTFPFFICFSDMLKLVCEGVSEVPSSTRALRIQYSGRENWGVNSLLIISCPDFRSLVIKYSNQLSNTCISENKRVNMKSKLQMQISHFD